MQIIRLIFIAYENITGCMHCFLAKDLVATVFLYPNLVSIEKCYMDVELQDGASSPVAGLEARIVDEIQRDGPLKVSTLKRRLGSKGLEKSLRSLRRQGQIEVAPVLDDKRTRTLSQRHYRPRANAVDDIPQIEKRAPRQALSLIHI